MYEYIQGSIVKIEDTAVILDVGGIGYRVIAPKSTLGKALENLNQPFSLFTEFIVREDSHTLYGFLTEYDRALFKLLINISGIGAKLAIQIMNRGSSEEVLNAIIQRDLTWLSSISGIGKKTAERLAVEAGEKASEMASIRPISLNKKDVETSKNTDTSSSEYYAAAIHTLVSLGLSNSESKQCVQDALQAAKKSEEDISDLSRLIHIALLHRRKKRTAPV